MQVQINEKNYGFLASAQQIEQLLRDYLLGIIPDVIAETMIAEGRIKPEQYLAIQSGGIDIESFLKHYLPSIVKVKPGEPISLSNSRDSLPGKLYHFALTTELIPQHADFLTRINANSPANDLIESTFAAHIGAKRGTAWEVGANLPMKEGKFRLNWGSILNEIKPLVFEEHFKDMTGSGLSGVMLYNVQSKSNSDPGVFTTLNNGRFVVSIKLTDYDSSAESRQWRVDQDTLIGPGPAKLCIYISSEAKGFGDPTPIFDPEVKTEVAELVKKLAEAIESIKE